MKILGYAGSYGAALEIVKTECPEAWANRSFSIQHQGFGYHTLPWVMLITSEAVNPIHEPH